MIRPDAVYLENVSRIMNGLENFVQNLCSKFKYFEENL